MFFFVWFFIPATKGVSLEDMDALFGVTEKATKTVTEDVDLSAGQKNDAHVTQYPVESQQAVAASGNLATVKQGSRH
jgi:hypothetical protein